MLQHWVSPLIPCLPRAALIGTYALAMIAATLILRDPGRRRELAGSLTSLWAFVMRPRVAAVAASAVLFMLTPPPVLGQSGAGCSGTAVTTIQGLDNLLATLWTYLMSGPVTKVLAAALFVWGLFGLFEHRVGPLVFGFTGSFIAAFAPTIIKAIFTSAQSGAAPGLCG